MNDEKIKEKISHQRDIKNNLWNAFVLSTGGTVGLLFITNSVLKVILLLIGLTFSLILLNAYFTRGDQIERLINTMKDGDK